MFRFLLLLAFVPLSVAHAIEVDGIAREHRPIVVMHEAGVTVNVLYWSDGEPILLTDDHLIRLDDRTIWSAPAGTYAVIQQGSAIVQVTRDGSPEPGPEPGPNPKPNPDPPEPDPQPQPDGIVARWLVVIEEQAERSEHSEFFNRLLSSETTELLNDLQIQMRVYDDDQEKGKPFLSTAGDVRPALILIDATGDQTRVTGKVEDIEAWIRGNVIR